MQRQLVTIGIILICLTTFTGYDSQLGKSIDILYILINAHLPFFKVHVNDVLAKSSMRRLHT